MLILFDQKQNDTDIFAACCQGYTKPSPVETERFELAERWIFLTLHIITEHLHLFRTAKKILKEMENKFES